MKAGIGCFAAGEVPTNAALYRPVDFLSEIQRDARNVLTKVCVGRTDSQEEKTALDRNSQIAELQKLHVLE